MKVHSAGCLEVVSYHMRENITTLVGLVVATLFIQVNIYVVYVVYEVYVVYVVYVISVLITVLHLGIRIFLI